MFLARKALAVVLLLALCGAAAGVLASRHHTASRAGARTKTYVAGDRSFSVSYPTNWHAGPVGATGAVLQRNDKRGLVLVRERPPVKGTLAHLVKGLPRQLARRFSDFRAVGASVAHLSTGPAVVYTFARTKADKVQTIVIAPTAKRSFTLEVVAPTGAHDAAREAGKIVRSLKAG
jgi:hypothetical protein